MENINSRSIYKLASIKVLLLILLTGFSYVAFGAVSNSEFWDAEEPEVIYLEHLEFAGKAHYFLKSDQRRKDTSYNYMGHTIVEKNYRRESSSFFAKIKTPRDYSKQKDDYVIHERSDSWKKSAGQSYANTGNQLPNPRFTFFVYKKGLVDIKLISQRKLQNFNHCQNHTDTYLYLLDENGNIKDKNDDNHDKQYSNDFFIESEQLSNEWFKFNKPCQFESGIKRELAPGKYTVVAATYNKGVTADFALSIGADEGIISSLIMGLEAKGSWSESGGRNKGSSDNRHYNFKLSKEERVTIDLISEKSSDGIYTIDTYLYLLNDKNELIEQDDDDGGNLQSSLTRILPAGSYKIVAATYAEGKEGNYKLTLKAHYASKLVRLDPTELEFLSKCDGCLNIQQIKNHVPSAYLPYSEASYAVKVKGVKANETITFTSSDNNIATINGSANRGEIKLKSVGETTIMATRDSDGFQISFKLFVSKGDQRVEIGKDVQQSFKILHQRKWWNIPSPYQAFKREAEVLEYQRKLGIGSHGFGNGVLTYSSSDEAVATVDSNGNVMVKAPGKTEITATLQENAFYKKASDKYTLTIHKAKPVLTPLRTKFILWPNRFVWAKDLFSVSYDSGNFLEVDSLFLKFDIENTSIAENIGYGLRLKSTGSTKITVTSREDKFYQKSEKSFNLHVDKGSQPAVRVSDTKNFSQGEKFSVGNIFKIEIADNGNSYKKPLFISEDKKVATVDSSGNVTILSSGMLKIKMYRPGNKNFYKSSDTFLKIKIDKSDYDPIQLAYTSKNKLNFTIEKKLVKEKNFKIEITNNRDSYEKPVFTSENKKVATVDSDGNVTMLSSGMVRIKIYRPANKYFYQSSDSYLEINIVKSDQNPIIATNLIMDYESDKRIKMNPEGGSGSGAFSYQTHNDKVVKVDNNQLIIVGSGKAKITVIKNGDYYYNEGKTEFLVNIQPVDPANSAQYQNTTVNVDSSLMNKLEDKEEANSSYDSAFLPPFEQSQLELSPFMDVKSISNLFSPLELNADNQEASNKINVQCGESFNFHLDIESKAEITYKSDDEQIATVSKNGRVKIVGIGTTTIKATVAKNDWYQQEQISYEINATQGHQLVKFKGENVVQTYGEKTTHKKDIFKGWGKGDFHYYIDFDNSLGAFEVDTDGNVTVLKQSQNENPIMKATVVAVREADQCYPQDQDSYSIEWHRNVVHSPKLAETADKEYKIEWTMLDYGANKKIELYYSNFINLDSPEDPKVSSDLLITETDVGNGYYKWKTSDLPEGDYYITAVIKGEKGDDQNEFSDFGEVIEDSIFTAKRPLRVEHRFGLAMDCSDNYNYPAKLGSAPNYCPEKSSMALIKDDKSILAFGKSALKVWTQHVDSSEKKCNIFNTGWHSYKHYCDKYDDLDYASEAPSDKVYKKIYANKYAFAALKNDGSITVFGRKDGAANFSPSGDDFINIYSAPHSFAAQRKNGSIIAWGHDDDKGHEVKGKFTRVIPHEDGFIALKDDGSISVWTKFKQYEPYRNQYKWDTRNFPFDKYITTAMHMTKGRWWRGHHFLPLGQGRENAVSNKTIDGDSVYISYGPIPETVDITYWNLPVVFEFIPTDSEFNKSEKIKNTISIPVQCTVGMYRAESDRQRFLLSGKNCNTEDFVKDAKNYFKLNKKYDMQIAINKDHLNHQARHSFSAFTVSEFGGGHLNTPTVVQRDQNGLARLNPQKQSYEWRQVGEAEKYIDIVADRSGTFVALTDSGVIRQFNVRGKPVDVAPMGGGFVKVFSSPQGGYLAANANKRITSWGTPGSAGGLFYGRVASGDAYSWNEFGVSGRLYDFLRYAAIHAHLPGYDENLKTALKLKYEDDPIMYKYPDGQREQTGRLRGAVVFSKTSLKELDDLDSFYYWLRNDPDIVSIPFFCEVRKNPDSLMKDDKPDTTSVQNVNCDLTHVPSQVKKTSLEINATYHMSIYHRLNDDLAYLYLDNNGQARYDMRGLAKINTGTSDSFVMDGFNEAKVYAGDGFLLNTEQSKAVYLGDKKLARVVNGADLSTDEHTVNRSKSAYAIRSNKDGSIKQFSVDYCGSNPCHDAPTDKGYVKVYNNSHAFAGLKADGSITTWGRRKYVYSSNEVDYGENIRGHEPKYCGQKDGPEDDGYITILTAGCSFTAIKADGTMYTWGQIEGYDQMGQERNMNDGD